MNTPALCTLLVAFSVATAAAQSSPPPAAATPSATPPPTATPAPELSPLAKQWAAEVPKLIGAEILENSRGDQSYVGRNVVVRGTVDGSIRLAGGNLYVLGAVNGSVSVVGGTVTVLGAVNGSVSVVGGELRVAGQIRDAVSVVGGLTVRAPEAVTPKSPAPAAATSKGVSFNLDRPEDVHWTRLFVHPMWVAWSAIMLVMWLALTALVAVIWPDALGREAAELSAAPARTAAVGLLFWIAFWLLTTGAALLSFVAIGLPFLFLLAGVYLAVKWYGLAVLFTAVGGAVLRRFGRPDASPLAAVLIGATLVGLVRAIPFVGFAAWQVAGWFAAGAAVLAVARQVRRPVASPQGGSDLPSPLGGGQ